MAATELSQFGEYTFKVANDSSFTTPTTVARISSANINDAIDVQSVDDFDQDIGDIIDQVLGGRTVSINFDANLVISDAGFQAINDDYKAGTYSYLEVTQTDTETTTTTWTLQLGGYWSTRNVTLQKPVATVAWTFNASEVVSDAVA